MAAEETPHFKIRAGDTVKYTGSRERPLGDEGTVLEVHANGECLVRWFTDDSVGLSDEDFLHRLSRRDAPTLAECDRCKKQMPESALRQVGNYRICSECDKALDSAIDRDFAVVSRTRGVSADEGSPASAAPTPRASPPATDAVVLGVVRGGAAPPAPTAEQLLAFPTEAERMGLSVAVDGPEAELTQPLLAGALVALEKKDLFAAYQCVYWVLKDQRTYRNDLARRVLSVLLATQPLEYYQKHFKSGCFVATVAFGDSDQRQVVVLRGFRDDVLRTHATGRFAIRLYEAGGPRLASTVSKSRILTQAARSVLEVVAWLLSKAYRRSAPVISEQGEHLRSRI